MKNYINKRRQFLKNIGMTALGVSTVPSSIFNMKTWATAASDSTTLFDDYKALVCFYMTGGNDGFNMLVPKGNTEYAEYQTTRDTIALPQADLLPINPLNSQGIELGLHPNMTGIQQLFEDGNLSFICNIGTKLTAETTQQEFLNQLNVPVNLMSHNDQTAQWQSAIVQERGKNGWAGRVADLLADCNDFPQVSMNVTLSTSPLFLRGEDTSSFALNYRGPKPLNYYSLNGGPNNIDGQRTAFFDAMYGHDYGHAFDNTFNDIMNKGIQSNVAYEAAITDFLNNGGLTTTFSGLGFSNNLKMVANSIAIGESLGFKRQIFFVEVTGFDNHDNLMIDHAAKMNEISVGLTDFHNAMVELGKDESVVTFSMSDFGRTLTSNGQGSDHAWGSNALVMGGPVIGKSLFGTYPSLDLAAPVNGSPQRGIIIPTTASDLYFAELALWFGVPMSNLYDDILPNLGTFYPSGSTDLPIGFLDI